MREEPVHTGHAHVVQPRDPVAHHLGGDRRLLRDRMVGGSSRGHHHVSDGGPLGTPVDHEQPRGLEVARVGGHLRHLLEV